MKPETFGRIMLYNADCMDVMREMPDKAFDLAIVDLPYFDGPDKLGYYGTSVSSIGVKRSPYQSKHWSVPREDYFRELDGITLPSWRRESLKAYGNAVVPSVPLQIFNAINQYEKNSILL